MLRKLTFLIFFFSLSVQAGHLESICKNAPRYTPIFGKDVVSYIAETDSGLRYVIDTFDGRRIFEASVKIKSIIQLEDKLWVLTSDEIFELGIDGSIKGNYVVTGSRNMTIAGNLLLIVRSGGVLSAFDTVKKVEVWSSYLDEAKSGVAVSVAFDGKNAQVLMTSRHENGFDGVATVSLEGKVLKQTPYNKYRFGVIDPNATSRWHNNQLVLNNGGWIHLISADQLARAKKIKPYWVAHAMGEGRDRHYMMLKGEFTFEGNTLVGCGTYHELADGEHSLAMKLFKVALP